ncbi:MAG: hypothetical protein WAV04_00565 [Candidatus Microsaccharimonas sp.]
MFPIIINPLALLFTVTTTFGVLVHDTQLDRAALAAVVPVSFASFAAIDSVLKSGESHVHVERVHGPNTLATLRSTVPRVQPRDDDRRYIQSKKVYLGTAGSSYLWPSV